MIFIYDPKKDSIAGLMRKITSLFCYCDDPRTDEIQEEIKEVYDELGKRILVDRSCGGMVDTQR